MTTFSQAGRSLTGWQTLRDLHQSIYAKTDLAGLEGRIVYDSWIPPTGPGSGASIDIRAATSVHWEGNEDELDHHWEMRRIDRHAPAWRALLPCAIGCDGHTDANCWIEINGSGLHGVVHRGEGEDEESTLTIHQRPSKDGWNVEIEVSFVWDESASDLLIMVADGAAMAKQLGTRGWHVESHHCLGADMRDGEVTIRLAEAALATIDGEVVDAVGNRS